MHRDEKKENKRKTKEQKRISQDMIIFGIAIFCIIVIFVYARTYYMPDKMKIEGWFSVITNMAISYVAATIFYYLQVYRPQKVKQCLAVKANQNRLIELRKMLEVTACVVERHYIIKDEHLDIQWNGIQGEEKIYYNYVIEKNGKKSAGNPGSYTRQELLLLNNEFLSIIKEIKQSSYAPYYKDDMVELLSHLENNNFFPNVAAGAIVYDWEIKYSTQISDIISEARKLAQRIDEYIECKEKYNLIDVDVTSKAIANGKRHPEILQSIANINSEITKQEIMEKIDELVVQGKISKEEGRNIIEKLEKGELAIN